jgi:hypothetical protein
MKAAVATVAMAARVATATAAATAGAAAEQDSAATTTTAAAASATAQAACTRTTRPTEIVAACAANGTRDARLAERSVSAKRQSRAAGAACTTNSGAVVSAFSAIETAECPSGAALAADGDAGAAIAADTVGRAEEGRCANTTLAAARAVCTGFARKTAGAGPRLDAKAIKDG